jgi:methane monooxygenase component C
LEHDALWIETAIEQRLAQLKALELSDDDLRLMCTTHELASDVTEAVLATVNEAKEVSEIERIAADFRRNYKPPIMPVNAWLRAERVVATQVMLARSIRRNTDRSIAELRAERGVKVVSSAGTQRYQVTLRFEDNEVLRLECGEGEDVVSAALRDDILLLSQCRVGQCATCKATCTKGERRLGDGVNVYSLPQEEQDVGMVLLCQTYPESNLEIDLPYGRDMVSMGPRVVGQDLRVRIFSFDLVTPRVYRLVVEHLNPTTLRPRELSFTPGQYVNVLIPGTDQWRSFSMASTPRDDGHIEFFVKRIPGGLFSEAFWTSARVGLELTIQGPFGMFHVNRRSGRPRAFLAGGTGLAPVLSMLRHTQETADTTETRVLVAVSESDSALGEVELASLQKRWPSVSVQRVVTSSRSDSGVIDQFRALLMSFATLPDAYLCGPSGLISAAEAVCRSAGLPGRHIYTERFLPSGPSQHSRTNPRPSITPMRNRMDGPAGLHDVSRILPRKR